MFFEGWIVYRVKECLRGRKGIRKDIKFMNIEDVWGIKIIRFGWKKDV